MLDYQVIVAGGGPVGLATAVELGRRGINVLIIEPREAVSHARPRCKTVNVRTMEHLRRWGIADELRARAPLSVEWSQDAVFCTSLVGRELSRFTGVLGLRRDGDRFPEPGQQVPQYILEELLRDTVRNLPTCTFVTGVALTKAEQDADQVLVMLTDGNSATRTVAGEYLVGCDGSRSAVREMIGARYVGQQALRSNFGMVFRAPGLWRDVQHGKAVHYWIINPECPALLGPIDDSETWWIIAFGIDRETGERDALRLIDGATGTKTDATVLSTDPWTARMQIVDRMRDGRIFLAGDAAHLNPPFGGHGLNTGIGDAVDLGWKLAGVLQGWGGPALLDSYELERRPLQERVIREATANMAVTSPELLDADLDADGPAGESARQASAERIQASKAAEFHSLELVLDACLDKSPVIRHEAGIAGSRLPHAWLGKGMCSVYDELGSGFTLLCLTFAALEHSHLLTCAAQRKGIPCKVVDLSTTALRPRYGAELVLVRPDQYVAWSGDQLPAPEPLIGQVTGFAAEP